MGNPLNNQALWSTKVPEDTIERFLVGFHFCFFALPPCLPFFRGGVIFNISNCSRSLIKRSLRHFCDHYCGKMLSSSRGLQEYRGAVLQAHFIYSMHDIHLSRAVSPAHNSRSTNYLLLLGREPEQLGERSTGSCMGGFWAFFALFNAFFPSDSSPSKNSRPVKNPA